MKREMKERKKIKVECMKNFQIMVSNKNLKKSEGKDQNSNSILLIFIPFDPSQSKPMMRSMELVPPLSVNLFSI